MVTVSLPVIDAFSGKMLGTVGADYTVDHAQKLLAATKAKSFKEDSNDNVVMAISIKTSLGQSRILAVSHSKAQQELMKKLIQSKDIHTLDENKVLELDSLPVSTKLSLKRITKDPRVIRMRQVGKTIHLKRN